MADQPDAAENSAPGAAPLWHVEMLGRYRIKSVPPASHDNANPRPSLEPIERFQTQKTALLFASLANSEGASLRDDLTLRLWPDADASAGRDRLSQALSWLRRSLETRAGHGPGSVLQADRWRIWLVPGSVTTDVAQFDALLAKANHAGASGDNVQAALCLEAAISLYGGPFLPGLCEDDDRLFHAGRRMALAYEDALRDAALACESLDRLTSAVTYARRLLAVNATDWDACYLTLRLLHRLGEHDEAQRTFAAFKRRYRESTGHSAPLEWERLANAAPRAESRAALEGGDESGRLPSPLTRYFGREAEIVDLSALLTSPEVRLLSLVGPGGSGKTRLAIELARRLDSGQAAEEEAAFKPVRRAFFVPLETIQRARGIVPAIYLALDAGNLPREDGMPLRSAVASMLKAAADHPLIVLDNVEHLAEDADTLRVLTDLLERVSSLTLLATSRRPLGHGGEQIFPVQPLPIPAGENADRDPMPYPSVRLFVDRAKSVRADFAVTPSNREAVAALCVRLEGLPLAIELCAAWSATLTPDELLAKLADRFALLVTRRPDVPPRHRGMYAAIDTSFAQISPELRSFLAALSVFRGGWFAEAAPFVVGEKEAAPPLQASDFLARLHEHSLLVTERVRDPRSDRHDARTRFRLLDTIREFAEGQIAPAERESAAKRHASYYLGLAEAAAPHLYGSGQRAWMDTLECEHDNLRAAFARFEQARNHADGLRLAIALLYFWNRRGYQTEACEYLEIFLRGSGIETDGPAPDTAALEREATARNGLGRALQARGETVRALREQETALGIWRRTGNTAGIARSLWELGTNARRRGDRDGAVTLFEESLVLAEAAGADILCAAVLMDLGNIAINQRDLPAARRLTQASLDRARRADAIFLSTGALNNLGEVARCERDLVSAAVYYEEALSITQTLGDRLSGILPRLNLAEVARLTGDLARAASLIHECLVIVRRLGEAFLAAQCLVATAVFASARGRWESAALLAGAVAVLRTTMTAGMNFADPDDEAQLEAALRAALGDARYAILLARGARDGLDAAFSLALSAAAVAPPPAE